MDSHPDTPQWTADRLAAVAPAWEPDLVRARTLINPQKAVSPRRGLYVAVAAATALIVVFASPSGRAMAQDLWYRWFVTRVAVVRLDLSKVPLDTSIRTNDPVQAVSSLAEAAAKAGFTPVLPLADVAGGTPALGVVGRVEVTQRIETRALAEALRREGVTDIEVPAEWNGTTLRAIVGPLVSASYPGDVEVLQTVPIRLEMPAAFPLERFAEIAFRAGGLPSAEARRLAREYARQPAWLLDLPADAAVVVETVTLPNGRSALLIEDPEDARGERATVFLSRPTRIYSVSSPTRAQSLRMANTLP